MILNWSCLDPTQMQLSPSYLHFCHKPRSLFWKQMLLSLSLRHVIWYTALQYETIFSHCIATAVWEDFVPPQCHNNLISSHLLGEISFFISLSGDAKQIAWHELLLALWCIFSSWDPNAFIQSAQFVARTAKIIMVLFLVFLFLYYLLLYLSQLQYWAQLWFLIHLWWAGQQCSSDWQFPRQ